MWVSCNDVVPGQVHPKWTDWRHMCHMTAPQKPHVGASTAWSRLLPLESDAQILVTRRTRRATRSREESTTMKFPILKSTNGQWFFRIVARNGATLAHSENYWNKADARSAAQTIINQAGGGEIVE